MTGPEHFAKAEALLSTAERMAARTAVAEGDRLADMKDSVLSTLAAAQVHATLAAAAATVKAAKDAGHLMIAAERAWTQVGAL